MRPALTEAAPTGLSGPVSIGAGLILLGLSPLIRGGNRHVALILLEWLSLLVLLLLLARVLGVAPRGAIAVRPSEQLVARGVWMLALAPLWVGLIQLMPLPSSLWASLPGHAVYVQGLAVAGAPDAAFRAASLAPELTVISLLAGIPLSAALLLAFCCSGRQLGLMARALVVFAIAQAVLGLLQMGPFPGLAFGAAVGGRAIGSFANPNHFASYIAMTVPLAILMLREALASPRTADSGRRRRRPAGTAWGLGLFLMLSAVLASGSRGGTVTCLVVTVLAAVLLPMRQGGRARQRRWRLAALLAMVALVALAVGVDALLARFEGEQGGYFASDRWQMVLGAWQGARTFWPLGSGLGTFAAVFPAFHPAGVRGFVEHAHNDYVQLLMEGGLAAALLAALALGLGMRQARALAERARSHALDSTCLLQASCGLGLLAVLLHSWVDFNLRIPANAMLAAFLLGAFLRPLSRLDARVPAQSIQN